MNMRRASTIPPSALEEIVLLSQEENLDNDQIDAIVDKYTAALKRQHDAKQAAASEQRIVGKKMKLEVCALEVAKGEKNQDAERCFW